MNTRSPNKITRAYSCPHQVSSHLIIFYVFIFNKENISHAQIRRIGQIQSEDRSHIIPFGYCLKDYKQIESAVLGSNKGSKSKVKMILVADVQSCEKILSHKNDNGTLKNLNEVYVCYQEEDYRSRKLLKDYGIINQQNHDLQVLINNAQHIFKKLKEEPTILRNYRRLDDKDEERRSFLMKVRANGAIHLDERQYDKYYIKFKAQLEKFILNKKQKSKDGLSSSNLTIEIEQKLQKAIKLLRQKRETQFKEEMLSLYQAETVFYQIINKSLMEFAKESFPWQSLALPFCLLYKSIKLHYHEEFTIDEIFGNKDQIKLYRAGKISTEEHHSMINALPDKPFFQMSSFISASSKQAVAYKFLDQNDPKTNCLMEIKLKRPHTKKQIQNFSFLYQSYAKLPNTRKDGSKVNQSQILLNALSVGRLVNIKNIKYQDIKKKGSKLAEKFKHVLDSQTIPVLSFEMGNFQNFLAGYTQQGRLKMTDMQQKVVENYLFAIDSIKNIERFDIGHSLQLSGQLEEAHNYFLDKLRKLQEEEENPQENEAHSLETKKSYHQICHRLAQTSFERGMKQQALNFQELSISTYTMIKQLDKSRTKKQHNRYLKKMYEEASGMLLAYKRSEQAIQKIKAYIQELKTKASSEKDRQIYFRYRIAEYLLDLGIINFKEGFFDKAYNYLLESEKEMDKIKYQIDYDNLKHQTFHLTFIFACIFTDTKWQNKKDYVEQKRAYNITQAANITGAEEKFKKVFNRTDKLKALVSEFVDDYKLNKMTISEYSLGSEQEEVAVFQENMMDVIKSQFEEHRFVQELKPAFQEFFVQFRESLQSTQNQKNGVSQKYKSLVEMVIKATNQKSSVTSQINEEEIRLFGQDIVRTKCYQWQNIDYLQNESALSLKDKIDSLIINLKENQTKLIQRDNKKKRQFYQNHLKSVVSCIAKSIYQQERFQLATPTFTKIKKKISCAIIFQQQGEQGKAEEEIQSIIKDTKSNPHFAHELIEGYLLSVKIYYSDCDFDFTKCLPKIKSMLKKDMQIHQKDMISKCKIKLIKAEKALNDCQNQRINLNNESSILTAHQNQQKNTLIQERKLVQTKNSKKNEKLITNSLLQKKIHLNLWKSKCIILQLSKKSEEQLATLHKCINEDIEKLEKTTQNTLRSQLYKNQGFYLEKSLEINQSFHKMNESYQQIADFSLITQKAELVTKIIFIFSSKLDHLHLSSKIERELFTLQRDCAKYPYYWRILLAVYFFARYSKDQQPTTIEKIIEQFEKYPSKNDSFKLKLKLLNSECKEPEEKPSEGTKIFNQSTVSRYIAQSAIKTNSFINNSHKRSVLMRNDSNNISRTAISKKESIKNEYMPKQKISIQIGQMQSFEERFMPPEPIKVERKKKSKASKTESLNDLPQQSIKSKEEEQIDNEDNLSEKLEPFYTNNMKEEINKTQNLHSQELKSYKEIHYDPSIFQELITGRKNTRPPQKRIRQSVQIKHQKPVPSKKNDNYLVSSDKKNEAPSTPNIENKISPNKRYKALFSARNRALFSASNSSNSSPFKNYEKESSYIRLKRQSSNNSQRRSLEEIKRQIIRDRSRSAQKGTIASAIFSELVDRKFEENRHSPRKIQINLLWQNPKETSISRKMHYVKNRKQMNQHSKHEHFDKDPFQQ